MEISKERLLLNAILRANANFFSTGNYSGLNGYTHYYVPEHNEYNQLYTGTNSVALGPSNTYTLNDYIRAGSGNDVVWGAEGADRLFGGYGDDIILGGTGADNDILNGDEGNDLLMAGGVNVSVGLGRNFLDYWRSYLQDRRFGDDESLKQLFTYSDGNAILDGGAGNDTLIGGNGDDEIYGDNGNDLIFGGKGNDFILADYDGPNHGSGDDTVFGEEGDDTIYGGGGDDYLDGGSGDNIIDGGDGYDVVSFAGGSQGVNINFGASLDSEGYLVISNAYGGTDKLKNIEGISGSTHADTIIGNTSNNWLDGGGGADIIDGGDGYDTIAFASASQGVWASLAAGSAHLADNTSLGAFNNMEAIEGSDYNDTLIGNAGDNSFIASSGSDYIDGGAGQDMVDYSKSKAAVNVNLLTGVATGGNANGDTLVSIENVTGSNYNDVLQAGATGSALYGGKGDDLLISGAGANLLDGGEGVDTVSYLASDTGVYVNLETGVVSGGYAQGDTLVSIEQIEGSNHNDTIIGSSGNDTIIGGAGDDFINAGAGNDYINGGAGADTIDGGDGIDTISYSTSSTALLIDLSGGASQGEEAEGDVLQNIEVVEATSFNDTIIAGQSGSTILGGAGDDLIYSGAGADSLSGGAGSDTVSYALSNEGVYVNLATREMRGGYAEGDTLDGVEKIVGSEFDDTIIGTSYSDTLYGGAGNDIISGNKSSTSYSDYIDGGDGFDLVSYESSNTRLQVNAITNIHLGAASGDTLVSIEGFIGTNLGDSFVASSEANYFDGGAGNDTVDYSYSNEGVTINLATGEMRGGYAEGDTLKNIEAFYGSSYDDHFIMGDDYKNVSSLQAGAGIDTIDFSQVSFGVDASDPQSYGAEVVVGSSYNDTLRGSTQNVTLFGGAGDDLIYASSGSEYIDGGEGRDTVVYSGTANMNINLATGILSGGNTSGDTLVSIEGITTGSGKDTIIGNDEDNYFDGGAGNDSLDGGAGNDTLIGGDGSDTLIGGAGDDYIEGGASYDYIDGGDGFDIASYANSNAGINVNLATRAITGGHATSDTLISIEGIVGSRYNDTFIGSAGNDYFEGGLGNDSFVSSLGADTMIGGDGIDTLDYSQSNAGVNVNLVTGEGQGGHAEGDIVSGFEMITGSAYSDTIIGTSANETIIGGAGADYMDAGEGIDSISYIASNAGVSVNLTTGEASGGHAQGDTVLGFEQITGSNYNDTITGSEQNDTIDGGSGNDYIYGSAGADSLLGGAGNDTLDYSGSSAAVNVSLLNSRGYGGDAEGDSISGFEALVGSSYNDTLVGASTNDTIIGGAGDDYIDGGNGNDSLVGGAGDDTLVGGVGSDTLDGGEGFDIADYTTSNGTLSVNLSTGIVSGGHATGDKLISIEGIKGSAYNDTFIGSAGNDYFDGGAGNDSFVGGLGADTMIGGSGLDTLDYSQSNTGINVNLASGEASGGHAEGDVLSEIEAIIGSNYNDTIIGTSANETIIGGAGADYMDAGEGIDSISYIASNAGVSVNLTTGEASGGHAQGDTVLGFEQLTGSNYNDTIIGSEQKETIDGGSGNDYIYGSAGADSLMGGAGIDTLDYSSSGAAVNVNLSSTKAYGGDAEGDSISGFEALIGSSYNDTLAGTSANDTLIGGAGDDYIDGGSGNDSLVGGAGDDTLIGGLGSDLIDGGDGFDIADYTGSNAAISVSLTTGVISGGHATGDSLISIEGIKGSVYNDTFIGSDGNDYFDGGNGNDSFVGGIGADTIIGGSGIDTLDYSQSDAAINVNLATGEASGGYAEGDVISGIEVVIGSSYNDTIVGSSANETFIAGVGASYIDAGGGIDLISYANSTAGINVNLTTGEASGGYAEGDTVLGFEQVIGSNYNDTFMGTSGNDSFDAGNGDDYVYLSGGADTLKGGAGIDTLDGSNATGSLNIVSSFVYDSYGKTTSTSDFEYIIGSNYNDTIQGGSTDETLVGGDGDDVISGGYGTNYMFGEAGNDTFKSSYGTNYYDGGDGFDIVDYIGSSDSINVNLSTGLASGGHAANDYYTSIEGIIGSKYNDTIAAGLDGTYVNGEAGNDFIVSGAGADTLDGGVGTDTLSYEKSDAGVYINLATGVLSGGYAEGDVVSGFEAVLGSSHNDTIIGSSANNSLLGGKGADYFDGGVGNDSLSYVYHDSAILLDAENALVQKGTGDEDTFTGIEYIIGSKYNDTLSFAGASEGVSVNINNFAVTKNGNTAYLNSFEIIEGSAYDDSIVGSINGYSTIYGGAGDDILVPMKYSSSSGGYNYLNGGDGFDIVDYASAITSVRIDLANSSNNGYQANGDTLVSIEGVRGGGYNDYLFGDSGDNMLDGKAGNDSLVGGAGNDTLLGGLGSDTINGGEGFDLSSYANATSSIVVSLATGRGTGGEASGDTLISIEGIVGSRYNDTISGDANANYLFGGVGNDNLTGGLGADTFAYAQGQNGYDVINDFCASDGDTILIETASGTGSISVMDGAALSGNTQDAFAGSDVLVVRDADKAYVYIDSDGDGSYNSSIDQSICLNNTTDISEDNILFTNKLMCK